MESPVKSKSTSTSSSSTVGLSPWMSVRSCRIEGGGGGGGGVKVAAELTIGNLVDHVEAWHAAAAAQFADGEPAHRTLQLT